MVSRNKVCRMENKPQLPVRVCGTWNAEAQKGCVSPPHATRPDGGQMGSRGCQPREHRTGFKAALRVYKRDLSHSTCQSKTERRSPVWTPALSSLLGALFAPSAPGRTHSACQDSSQNSGKTNNVLMTLFLFYLRSDANTFILFWTFFLVAMVP